MTLTLLTNTIQHTLPVRPDPRLVSAEAVAACALHLVMQWAAWQTLNQTALAAIGTNNHPDAHNALAAFELLDQAVQAWAPHAHPAISAASHALGSPSA